MIFESKETMELQNKKTTVLHQLSQASEPLSLPDLLKKLGEDYKERTVRRWLTEMVKEGLIKKFGSKRGTTYQAIPQSNQAQQDLAISCFGSESIKVIEQVRRPIYERSAVAYADDWFDAYQPNSTFYISLSSRMQLHKIGERSKREDPAGTYAHQIFNRLLIDLSYNSSRLEGNTYSLLDTQRLVLEGVGAESKLDEEKIMILNHKEAIRYLVDTAPRLKTTKETICTLHYLLSEGLIEARYAGKIRDHGVRIGGSTYAPFEDSKRLQLQLDRISQKALLIEDPYEQSLFLLIHISYLQAFSGVNKRTARLSANIPLIKSNLVPLSFNDVERDDYNSAMIAIYEQQDIRPLLDLYLFSYKRTCDMYDSTVQALGFDEVRVRYRQQRRSLIREIILSQLVGAKMKEYISQSSKIIEEKDRVAFIEDTLEDLKEIDQIRLVSLGITSQELNAWIIANAQETF